MIIFLIGGCDKKEQTEAVEKAKAKTEEKQVKEITITHFSDYAASSTPPKIESKDYYMDLAEKLCTKDATRSNGEINEGSFDKCMKAKSEFGYDRVLEQHQKYGDQYFFTLAWSTCNKSSKKKPPFFQEDQELDVFRLAVCLKHEVNSYNIIKDFLANMKNDTGIPDTEKEDITTLVLEKTKNFGSWFSTITTLEKRLKTDLYDPNA